MALSPQLLEAGSWRIATELVRRHPRRLTLIETHPGGGLYDCLTVLVRRQDSDEMPRTLIDLNREGSVHIYSLDDGQSPKSWPRFWSQLGAAPDPKQILDRLEVKAGLSHSGAPPVSSPEVLTYRLVAAALASMCFGRHSWECRNGFCDTAGMGGGVRREWFSMFPLADEWQPGVPTPIPGEPAYGFWFLLRDGEPRLCLTADGRTVDRQGTEHNLAELYGRHGRILPALTDVAGHILR